MKVLFLDMDGVVNNAKTPGDKHGYMIDPYMALLVNRIVWATDCRVVISSDWRHGKENLNVIKERVIDFYDVTPSLPGYFRGDEIQDWLDRHTEVTKYAILDDTNDAGEGHGTNFFKTWFETGLTDEIAERVITHLNS